MRVLSEKEISKKAKRRAKRKLEKSQNGGDPAAKKDVEMEEANPK